MKTSDTLSQAAIGRALGISPASMTKCKHLGMPVHSVEAARAWRAANLDPGRVKGAWPAFCAALPELSLPDFLEAMGEPLDALLEPANLSVADVEAAGRLIDDALAQGNAYAVAVRTHQLREQLRTCNARLDPCLSLRVWLSLHGYRHAEESGFPNGTDMGQLSTGTANALDVACDWDDNALFGWPDGDGSDDD